MVRIKCPVEGCTFYGDSDQEVEKHARGEHLLTKEDLLRITEKRDDPVNHPSHYTSHPSGIETIEITRHMNFNLGNVIKYVMRAGKKGRKTQHIQDLKKARWYLDDEIKKLEG